MRLTLFISLKEGAIGHLVLKEMGVGVCLEESFCNLHLSPAGRPFLFVRSGLLIKGLILSCVPL